MSEEFACKSIKKQLDAPSISPAKQQQHLENIKREEVVEDSSQVHIVMELCRGGELLQRIGKHHYSERTVASYMRAVLRTLAQCHHHRILHRDVKP
ncbi:protein kinase domain-containing protein, partial [Haematococcus lacustris]